MQKEEGEEGEERSSIDEENARLRQELSKCQDDKEFVWMLWKDLQKENPDLTSAVDMIITREELKNEQRIRELSQMVQAKQEEEKTLSQALEEKEKEVEEKDTKLENLNEEVTEMKEKVEILKLEKQNQTHEEAIKRQRMRETCAKLEEELEKERKTLFFHHEEMKRLVSNCQEQEEQIKELKIKNERKEENIKQLEKELSYLNRSIEEISRSRKEQEINLKSEAAELQSARRELRELRQSRDVWANHTTLQTTTVQRLQQENSSLREQLSELRDFENKKEAKTERETEPERGGRKTRRHEIGREGNERGGWKKKTDSVDHHQAVLERVEKELFETQMELEAKAREVEGLRGCHERRAKRMRALQSSLVLVEKHLQTYTASEKSPSQVKGKEISAEDLRRENSTAVWNELASYKSRCQEQERLLCEMEEERDTLKARYLQCQSSLAELRRKSEHHRNDLERKLCAVAKAEEASVLVSAKSHRLETRVSELEGLVHKLKREKVGVLSQLGCSEKELTKLRDEAMKMQATIADLTHHKKQKEVQVLVSIGTMTEDGGLSRGNGSSSSVTHSATQVDLVPSSSLRPGMRDAAVSPIIKYPRSLPLPLPPLPPRSLDAATQTNPLPPPPHPPASLSLHSTTQIKPSRPSPPPPHYLGTPPIPPPPQTATISTQTQTQEANSSSHSISSNKYPLGRKNSKSVRRRTHSEGGSLIYRRKTKTALKRVNGVSKDLRHISTVRPGKDREADTLASLSGGEGDAPVIITRSIGCQCDGGGGGPDTRLVVGGVHVTGNHCKCALYQQELKTLRNKLKTVTKQLVSVGAARQSLVQSLESEKRDNGRARTEIRELNLRLQGMKTVVQSLQSEVHRLQETNQQLNQRLTNLSETRKGRSEADWKHLESDKKELSEKCMTLSETVKSLEETVQQKTSQLNVEHEKYVRSERDVRQKRQLLDSQRDKTRTLTQQVEEDQTKIMTVENEANKLRGYLEQTRHKVDSQEKQLVKLKENAEAHKMLGHSQNKLQTTACRLSAALLDCRKLEQQLHHLEQTSRQELKKARQENADRVQAAGQRLQEREEQLGDKLRHKDLFLREYQQFVMELAAKVKEWAKHKDREPRSAEDRASSTVEISDRVREIARSTLELSDLEIDAFFSTDHDKQQDVTSDAFIAAEDLEQLLSKIPFASNLVLKLSRIFYSS